MSVELNTYYWQHEADLIVAVTTTPHFLSIRYRNLSKRKSQHIERQKFISSVWVFTMCLENLFNRFNILIIAESDFKRKGKRKAGREKRLNHSISITDSASNLLAPTHSQPNEWIIALKSNGICVCVCSRLVKFQAGISTKKEEENN